MRLETADCADSVELNARIAAIVRNRSSRQSPRASQHVVVEGSVLLERDRVRISVRLIDALHDQHLWAQTYEPRPGDVTSWQSEVARTIAQQIEVTLTPREDTRLRCVHSVDPEAHTAYLRDLYYGHQSFTETAFRTAIAHFSARSAGAFSI